MYVVLFYEFLEDLLVDLVIEGIQDMYREELFSDIREQMFIVIENNSIVGFVYIFFVLIMIVFCCFIFCYILVEEM